MRSIYIEDINEGITEIIAKDYNFPNDISTQIETSLMHEVKVALDVMFYEYYSGNLVDNPKYVSYRPFEIIRVPYNENLKILRFDKLEVIVDCYTYSKTILWRQVGCKDEELDIRHLLYRISKLSIKSVPTGFINNILIGLKIVDTIRKEADEEYTCGDIHAVGIAIVGISLVNKFTNRHYSISIQFEDISLWNKEADKPVISKTRDINEVIEGLLVEALNTMNEDYCPA